MPPPENLQATQKLLQELLASITTLHKEVTTLKVDDDHRSYPQTWPHDGKNGNCWEDASCDNDNNGNRDSNFNPSEVETDFPGAKSDGSQFQLSEEGEASLETTCGSCMPPENLRQLNNASLTQSGHLVPLSVAQLLQVTLQ